jgi:hypothetical protein
LAYGFKEKVFEDIKRVAVQYRNAIARQKDVTQIELRQKLLDFHLAQDSFTDYLQHACPVDVTQKDAEICRTHPKYFLA